MIDGLLMVSGGNKLTLLTIAEANSTTFGELNFSKAGT